MRAQFPVATELDWRGLVEKTLKGADADSLNQRTASGLAIAPLYRPATAPDLALPPRDAERPWDVRTLVSHPDPDRANRDVLTDLEGGAASISLKIGVGGVAVTSARDLERVLKGVLLELATVGLDAGFQGPQAADWLATVAKGSPAARLAFHLDPISAWAEAGHSPGPVEAHLISAATVAARLASQFPKAELALASGRVVHEAGGSEAGELAFAVASALVHARALNRAGLTLDEAFGGITLGLAADGDYLVTLAKLRAARLVWARLTQACRVTLPARIEVRSSRRMLTARDSWTNMLRLSAAAVGASLGGADAISLGSFTDAIGHPTAFARRQSRNAQLVLMEEAHLGRVADPGAGSGYIEALTGQIARAAWDQFQAIERQGGLIAALEQGHIAAGIAEVMAARDPEPKIVGVTAYPPRPDISPEVEVLPVAVATPEVRMPGPDSRCPALVPVRLSAIHEAA